MADINRTTIAQLLFVGDTAVDFNKIVADLGNVLAFHKVETASDATDHTDLVTFNMPECRILLSLSNVFGNGFSRCLCVAVGPPGACERSCVDNDFELLCSRLVERIQNRFSPVAVVWRHVAGAVDAEFVNFLSQRLLGLSPVLSPIDSLVDLIAATERSRGAICGEKVSSFRRTESAQAILESSQKADLPLALGAASTSSRVAQHVLPAHDYCADLAYDEDAHELHTKISRVRIALYSAEPVVTDPTVKTSSLQMRLAAHALNAAMLIACLPSGRW